MLLYLGDDNAGITVTDCVAAADDDDDDDDEPIKQIDNNKCSLGGWVADYDDSLKQIDNNGLQWLN